MVDILNDVELRRVLGTVIVDGDESCVRPNSYTLRLGAEGEFLNSGKEFHLGKQKKGIKVQPGQSVAVTALEQLDFSRETVGKFFPDHDLHAFISPTTDLSREGIVAPTTQADPGYKGTLNWTITNTSSEERRFVHQERIYRLTVLKLGDGERPESLYAGDYQEKTGYVRSQRSGAPVGMKDNEWEDAFADDSPEILLDSLIKSGYPWSLLGERLKAIDGQFRTVTEEYSGISDSIGTLQKDVDEIRRVQSGLPKTIRDIIGEQLPAMQDRWLLRAGACVTTLIGLGLAIYSSDRATDIMERFGSWIGWGVVFLSVAVLVAAYTRRK